MRLTQRKIIWFSAIGLLMLCYAGSRAVHSESAATNEGATLTYLMWQYRLVQRQAAGIAMARAATNKYVDHVLLSCLSIVSNAPIPHVSSRSEPNALAQQELALAQAIVDGLALRVEKRSVVSLRFIMAKIRLVKWESEYANRLMRRRTTEEREFALLGSFDICKELGLWAQAGYSTVPVGTRQFLARWSDIERNSNGLSRGTEEIAVTTTSLGKMILNYIARYQHEPGLVKRLALDEARVARAYTTMTIVASGTLWRGLGFDICGPVRCR